MEDSDVMLPMSKLIRLHKRLIAMAQVNLGLSDYQIIWLSFTKGLLLGIVLMILL